MPDDQPRLDPFGNQATEQEPPDDASAIEGGEGAGDPAVRPPDEPAPSDAARADTAPMTQRDVL
jgi:hypothetical protein